MISSIIANFIFNLIPTEISEMVIGVIGNVLYGYLIAIANVAVMIFPFIESAM